MMQILIFTIFIHIVAIFSESCDDTFYITSNLEICIDDKCQKTHFSEISLGTGPAACFIDLHGFKHHIL